MDNNNNTQNMPILCANGCGFYGNPMNNNLCSKCLKELGQEHGAHQQQTTSTTATAATATDSNLTTSPSSSSSSKPSTSSDLSSTAASSLLPLATKRPFSDTAPESAAGAGAGTSASGTLATPPTSQSMYISPTFTPTASSEYTQPSSSSSSSQSESTETKPTVHTAPAAAVVEDKALSEMINAATTSSNNSSNNSSTSSSSSIGSTATAPSSSPSSLLSSSSSTPSSTTTRTPSATTPTIPYKAVAVAPTIANPAPVPVGSLLLTPMGFPTPASNGSSTPMDLDSRASTPGSMMSDTSDSPAPGERPVQNNKGRCFLCRAKIPLAKQQINKCRCEYVFCDSHKAASKHDCDFDFAKMGKEQLTKNNPRLNDKPRGGRSFTRIQE